MAKKSFYRPHNRVYANNGSIEVFDKKTGEIKKLPMPSMTKQEFKTEVDINNIVKQFKPHHMAAMLQANLQSGAYQDLPDSYDYQAALDLVRQAENSFMTVPAKIRDQFGQDPAAFLAFVTNPDNLEEVRKLGLARPAQEPPAPIRVEVTNPEPPPSPPKA